MAALFIHGEIFSVRQEAGSLQSNRMFLSVFQTGREEVQIYTTALFWKVHFLVLPLVRERTITLVSS